MARKGIGFRKSLRDQQLESLAGQSFYAAMMIDPERRAEQEKRIAAERAVIAPKRASPRKLEAPVVAAISELLAVHPRVIWAMRVNSGAAQSASGAPIWFHKMLRMPEPMRMPDFFGLSVRLISYNSQMEKHVVTFAVEAKAPGWTKPTNDREREQAAFLRMVRSAGGVALFATSADEVAEALK